jgi:endonuclease YncB( thermonuclease family)
MAIRARDLLHDKIYGEMVELKNVGNEKYGRILADVYLHNENINQWLINEHIAVPYDGGKKQTWTNNWGQ